MYISERYKGLCSVAVTSYKFLRLGVDLVTSSFVNHVKSGAVKNIKKKEKNIKNIKKYKIYKV